MAAIAPPASFPIRPVPPVSATPASRPAASGSAPVRARFRRLVVFEGRLP
jgi:hypothetical protein